MNERKSLLISAGGHAAILILSIIVGLFAHVKNFKVEPIMVNLLPGPVGDGSKDKGTTPAIKKEDPKPKEKEKPKITKKEKKEIITRPKEIVKRIYNPKDDMKQLEDLIKKNKLKEDKTPTESVSPSNTGAGTGRGKGSGGGSTYDSIIQQIVRNNWMQPGRAIVGPNPPVVLVAIRVDRNGNILASKITKSSGIPQLDESALKAIEDSDPLPVFPSYLTGNQRDFELRFIVEG